MLVVVWFTGGVDFGWVRATAAAKPALVVWTLVPIRLVLHGWPHRIGHVAAIAAGARAAVQSTVVRVPAAVSDAAFAFGVTRAAEFVVGFLVNLLYPAERPRPFSLPFAAEKVAEPFAAWDSGWYFDIAMRGYYYSADGQNSIPFFPLYPMMMRALAWPFGLSAPAVWTAGIVISGAAFFAGLVALHRLTHRTFADRDVARRAVLYASVFPFSFFLSRVYPEGLFFLLTVLAVSFASRARWWQAGVCGGLAALTRPQGILIAVPLLLMAARSVERRQLAMRLVALMPIPIAFLAYHAYIGWLAEDPMAWLTSESRWGYSLGHPPWEQLVGLIARVERYGLYDYFSTSNLAPYRLIQGVAALLLIAMIPVLFVRLGAALGTYVLISLLVPLSGNALEGIGRYAAVLFPVFMTLATIKAPRFHEAFVIVSSLFLALFTGLFTTWRPIY